VDRLAQQGNPDLFPLAKPLVSDYNYSFSGLKTSFLYLVRDKVAENPDFIAENITHLCAAVQKSVVEILMKKLHQAVKDLKINEIALAGGVSANSALRQAVEQYGKKYKKNVYIPPVSYTTDNAGMIAITGYLKFLNNEFCGLDEVPYARVSSKL
jgi:N6-L-threonylcarbamoyladenine synthase